MPRILGVDIPNDKPTHIALRYINGIGPTLALKLCDQLRIDPQRKARDMSGDDLSRLQPLAKEEDAEHDVQKRVDEITEARLNEVP